MLGLEADADATTKIDGEENHRSEILVAANRRKSLMGCFCGTWLPFSRRTSMKSTGNGSAGRT